MSIISPYNISVAQPDIDDLNERLLKSKFPDTAEDSWEYGAPIKDVARIAKYWREDFDWRAYEARLNRLPHFEATITLDGFDPFQVHFVHQKSTASDAIPLLFVHGWPGSFIEVIKMLPLLADSEKRGGPAFHVIAPSLPNFGFSSMINRGGFGMPEYAETCHQLMLGLGYKQYASQGGDWGSLITRTLATLHPESLRALHLNMISVGPPGPSSPFAFATFALTHLLDWYTPAEKAGLRRTREFVENGSAYLQIQRTRPNTIGAALASSPVGLLAWIYDKLVAWTDGYPWTAQEVCEWVSVYWFSVAGPAASVVIYHEAFKDGTSFYKNRATPSVRKGFSYFPKEIASVPRMWGHQMGNVVFEREHERGGHFAAYEQPEALVGDLCAMFGRGGGASGSVKSLL
ncbi:Alpha/Beta hydrolase protein [Xylariaceae sp. FL0804]|nr:Alpha/Beta hydrolase protein [Xylariaceae sp. FL0804]